MLQAQTSVYVKNGLAVLRIPISCYFCRRCHRWLRASCLFVDEVLFKLQWFGGSGGGGGPAAEFGSQMISKMFESYNIRLRKGRAGGPAAELRSQMTKQKKAQGPPIILGMLGFRIICNPRIAKISNSHFAADGAGGEGPAAEFRSQMTTGQILYWKQDNTHWRGGEGGGRPPSAKPPKFE